MEQEIRALFDDNNGILQTRQLEENGVYYRKLQKMIQAGEVEQVKRGFYRAVSEKDFSDAPLLISLFPDGIICMDSALQYYGYTDRTPSVWHIAVDSTTARKRFYIDYPFVQPHFVEKSRFPVGITDGMIDGYKVQIYDRERTVCDILLHRNKIDPEVYNYAVQSYLNDEKKNVTNLIPYAQKLRVEKKVREVIGVWL